MEYQKELNFLREVFKKSYVNTYVIEENDKKSNKKQEDIFDSQTFFQSVIGDIQPNRLYKFTNQFKLSYRFLLLPSTQKKTALCIGPFLNEQVSVQYILEMGENYQIPPQRHHYVKEFYSSLPILGENSHLLIMLYSFCEIIWKTPSFTTEDYNGENAISFTPLVKSMVNVDEDLVIDKTALERRYAFENELIRTVALGKPLYETLPSSLSSNEFFENRSNNPIQNAKNYTIILNTLLRKGAEQGGVHPVYINQMSSEFALKIENLSSSSGAIKLMNEMFIAYCRLVRKHNLKKYPLVVQKTILKIDEDLSAPLSSKYLAEEQGVSLGYLSSVFKKETGKTISEFVCIRRMEYAEHLLNTTNLQVQTIALHCGIMDVQYFSKQFKKYKGKTPSQFRKK